VSLSRIVPEKGVGLAVDAIQRINRLAGSVVAKLDIWGGVAATHAKWFDGVLQSGGPNVRYCGLSEPSRVVALLSDYDALVFPTVYPGESFPGVVIEAFAAGVPVVASDWRDNTEIVQHEENGLVFKAGDLVDLCAQLQRLIRNPQELSRMKEAARRSSMQYHADNVVSDFIRHLALGPTKATA
jgi:glycosyltransferase involved in cell wall biosynthesis